MLIQNGVFGQSSLRGSTEEAVKSDYDDNNTASLERRVATSNTDLAGAKPRIINGSNPPKDRYTWFTRVIMNEADGTLGGCGGSLIAPGTKSNVMVIISILLIIHIVCFIVCC
jgi:hypothetical protein